MWGRSTHCGRGGCTSGALHLRKRIAHVENCEVLGWYSAMIARHDGGKSAPIVAASHAFFFSTKYGCGTRVGKAAESSAAQEWSLECRNRRSPCNLLVGSQFLSSASTCQSFLIFFICSFNDNVPKASFFDRADSST